MKFFSNEEIIWQSKDKKTVLTTHRLREVNKSLFGSSIKSIMLNELDSCELRTDMDKSYLRRALYTFLIINGGVFIMNHFILKSELMKVLLEGYVLQGSQVTVLFYISIIWSVMYIILFFTSIKKVFSFYSNKLSISLELKRMSFDEREYFISEVEQAKLNYKISS